MTSRRELNGGLAILLSLAIACPPARALVSLNDGHDHLYVTASAGYEWDSNVFANSNARSDYASTYSLVAEYRRRAGWIGVNATAAIDATRYQDLKDESFQNPQFSLELTKQTGRTTGALTLSAARQSRADAAVNVRSTSWNYGSGVNYKYPLAGVYTLSGQVGYSLIKYYGGRTSADASAVADTAVFPDLSTYTASVDLLRVFSTERDLLLGYRYRRSDTSANTNYDDHAASVGLSGRLIRGVNGSVRVGYQVRQPHGMLDESGRPQGRFGSWTASASATYPFNKRLNFTGSLAKDFSTTANDISVDTTTASLDFQYAYSSHWQLTGTVSAGDNRFLGDAGRVVIALGNPPILGPSRRDENLSASVAMNYSMNDHLKVALAYAWFSNWSNTSFADFVRRTYNLNLSSRW